MKFWSRSVSGSIGLLVIAAAALLWHSGCEDSPDTDGLDQYFDDHPYISDPRFEPGPGSLDIEPLQGTVSYNGDQVLFTVTGGKSPFTWDVAKPSVGTVQAQGNDRQAVYTAVSPDENSVIVSDKDGKAAIGSVVGEDPAGLQIIPGETVLTATETNGLPLSLDGTVITFRGVGGTPPYSSWQVSAPDLGTIDANGRYVVRGTWGTGKNTVTVDDSAGNTATATVTTELGQ
jgi:hypothetical protein